MAASCRFNSLARRTTSRRRGQASCSCIHRSLREVFPEVGAIPGDTVHFFAAKQAGTLTDQPDELLRRLKSRQLDTTYVREYYLPFRMSPDRMSELAEQIRPGTRHTR